MNTKSTLIGKMTNPLTKRTNDCAQFVKRQMVVCVIHAYGPADAGLNVGSSKDGCKLEVSNEFQDARHAEYSSIPG